MVVSIRSVWRRAVVEGGSDRRRRFDALVEAYKLDIVTYCRWRAASPGDAAGPGPHVLGMLLRREIGAVAHGGETVDELPATDAVRTALALDAEPFGPGPVEGDPAVSGGAGAALGKRRDEVQRGGCGRWGHGDPPVHRTYVHRCGRAGGGPNRCCPVQ
jgi:hypothetical protein